MSEEEILRKKLDRLNENSHYGLMIETTQDLARIWNVGPGEIRKIVEDYISAVTCDFKPLQTYPKPPIYIKPIKLMTLRDRIIEESTKELQNKVDKLILKKEAIMHEDCYFCIKRDICTKDVPKPCRYKYTEEERIADQAADMCGNILDATRLPKTYQKKKEEIKMNATSTENFHDIIAIDFELQTFPDPDTQDKFIVSATNRDDIFCFVFEGPYIADTCRKAGLFTSWEKDQKIKELEEKIRDLENKNNELTKAYNILDKTLQKSHKKCNKWYEKWVEMLRKYNLEREANEAQHKFFREYAGKGTEIEFNYAIGDTDEVSYVIVDKEMYQTLKDNRIRCAMINGRSYTFSQMVDKIFELEEENNRLHDTAKEGDYVCLNSVPYSADDIKKLKEQIKKLEELKTPTIENFADEEPADNVNHPSHYTGKYECIDVMQDVFGDEATDNFCLCNAFKYIWRARKKNGLEDVKKAVWYLNKYIEEAEKDGVSKGERV